MGGDGFILWLASFSCAAAAVVREGGGDEAVVVKRLQEIEISFEKVWRRFEAHRDLKLKGKAEDPALASFNKIQLSLARTNMKA